MMLCDGRRVQRKLLLALLLLFLTSAVVLCFILFRPPPLPADLDSAGAALRFILLLGALLFLLSCGAILPLHSLLEERTRAREELEYRHTLLALQQQHSPDDIMVVDPGGTVIFHNRRYAELWGSRGGLASFPFQEALAALAERVEDRQNFLREADAIAGSGDGEIADQVRTADGRVFDRYSAPLRAPSGGRIGRIWRLRDSTPAAAALAALQESETTYRGILESSADSMVLVNEARQIILVNEQFEVLFGYRRSEVLGKDVDILVPRRFTGHADYVRGFFEAPRKRMMGHGLKLVALRKDGSEFPAEIGLSPMRTAQGVIVSAAIRDITAGEVAERKAAAAAAYARTLFEGSPDPLVTIDIEGVITDVNEAMIALTGKSREALVGSAFAGHFTDPEMAGEVHRIVFSHGVLRDHPLTVRTESGQAVDVLYNAAVHRDEGGGVAGAFAAARDMTQRQTIEAELRELNRVLEERVARRTERLLTQAREVVQAAGVVTAASRSIRESANQAVRSAIDTSAALSHTTAAIEEVRRTALDSSDKARHVSLAAQRSAQVAQEGRKAVQGAIGGMARIQTQVTGSAESIIRLSDQSRTIGEIIATVNDLAEQSNLLAVNAALEASKAGRQGKGFAVVAREVKSLSEQSKVATAQVRSILDDIRRATDGAVLASEQGKNSAAQGVDQAKKVGEAIGQMEESIERCAQAALQIATSCQQQLIGLNQVAHAMQSITDASESNVDGLKRLEATLKHLEELGERLKQRSSSITGG